MSDDRVDATIDDVAREMTRGELPPDFRGRVIDRLESGERTGPWRQAWVLSSLAAAAIVLLAVVVMRAPWRAGGPGIEQQARSEVQLKSEGRLKPDPTYESRRPDPTSEKKDDPADVGSDLSRIASRSPRTAATYNGGRLPPYEGGLVSDLTPAPITLDSLDVEAMDVAPLGADAMESIAVPRLDVEPLEVPAIGEQ